MSQSDFISAIRQIAAERKIDADEIINAVKEAVASTYKAEYGFGDQERLKVEINPEEGNIQVFAEKEVVANVEDESIEISTDDAKKTDKTLKLGDFVLVDITPKGDFGRIAAQTARQIIVQRLREAEKDAAIRQVQDKVGEIITVFVQKVTQTGDVICEVNRAKAVMPKEEKISGEFYKLGSNIKVLLKEIAEEASGSKYLLVSRADPEFLHGLFKMEVPEIESGTVEIVSIAREPGSRSKVAVRSLAQGVDPIGSCVGQRGIRINAISNELKGTTHEEKIDIIPWSEDRDRFLMNSISPAEALEVKIVDEENKEAMIVVPDMKESLAIGREGQNVRLASKLTGWNIQIKGESEAAGRARPEPEAEVSTDTEVTEEAAE
jgi:N utilization substance protein A